MTIKLKVFANFQAEIPTVDLYDERTIKAMWRASAPPDTMQVYVNGNNVQMPPLYDQSPAGLKRYADLCRKVADKIDEKSEE